MGDRLITKISYKGEFFAASYQHWAAADAEELHDICYSLIREHNFFDDIHNRTKEEAAQILYEMLEKYNKAVDIPKEKYKPSHGLFPADTNLWDCKSEELFSYHSDEQQALIDKGLIPIGKDRTNGFITIDKKIADDWEGWAEEFNIFD